MFVKDYGEPVSLEAAECQFAVMDAPDGAPVAYVYEQEKAELFSEMGNVLYILDTLRGATNRLDAHDRCMYQDEILEAEVLLERFSNVC
jgi:hypothetical protein